MNINKFEYKNVNDATASIEINQVECHEIANALYCAYQQGKCSGVLLGKMLLLRDLMKGGIDCFSLSSALKFVSEEYESKK